jgi:3-hydroxybutyryl-CoA dehydrogenase
MDSSKKVAVIGAGTMGSGIAQLAGLRKTLDKLVEKGKLTAEQADGIHGRITPASDLKELAGSGLVIEAIIEDLGIKQKLFAELEGIVATDAILATNTSSLSVTAIAGKLKHPERMVGLHFFNPAPLLPLVEVVPGLATDAALATRMMALMQAWGKTPVVCKDTPGFIVNRVARPFYGEAIRIYEEGIADMPTIDAAMKSVGFKMGPFELMDLIGNDINFTVTKTVWEAFFYDPRYKPSFTQQRQVESGRLGRKSGRGYYQYDASGAIVPQTSAGSLAEDPAGHAQAAGSLRTSGDPAEVSQVIIERILAMLINEAADALFWQVASAQDIDLAMTKGVNYPKGLLAWAEEKGAPYWLGVLERLQAQYGEDRYRPSTLLRSASQGGSLIR